MCDPPTRIEATNVRTLRPGSAPPTRPNRRTVRFTSASRPRRTINVAGTINPASATNVSSSKITSTPSIECDTELTGSASRGCDNGDFRHRHRPCSGGTFRGYAKLSPSNHRWIEAKGLGWTEQRDDRPQPGPRLY